MQTISQLPPVPKPRKETWSASDLQLLQEWRVQHGQAVRQLTVRQLSTKDKPATLPISAYQKPPPEPQIVDVQGMLGSDPERTHMPGDGVQGPTATPAIIYPVHSVVATTAPVSETSSFGIVKLQADVTDADQASSTMVYVECNGLCWKPGMQFPIPFLRLPSRYTSIIDHWACWQLVNFIWCHNADRRGLQKLLRVGHWKWGRTCRRGRGEHAGCTRFLGHCCDTWTGVGSSEQLWA